MRATPSRRFVRVALLVAGVVASPVVLHAQVTSDPTRTTFLSSADHALKLPDGKPALDRYELLVSTIGAAEPFAVINLGKPKAASNGSISVAFRARLAWAPPVGVPSVAVVRAVGPYGSADSAPSNEFMFESLAQRTRGDFDGDGDADLALFRPSNGTWLMNGRAPSAFGRRGDIPVPADYDGSAGDERAVFRPSTGEWLIEGRSRTVLGQTGDVPVPADYDGDGRADLAVFRPSTGEWFIPGVFEGQWGSAGDIPVPGDYDGDGSANVAVFRPSTGVWYVANHGTFKYGAAGDLPIPADYDGDGTVDAAVFRRSTATWYVRGQFTRKYGAASDVPVPQDLNADGKAELVLWRPTTNRWYALYDRALSRQFPIGANGDFPALALHRLTLAQPLDADADRRADIGVFRPSTLTWYLRTSRKSFNDSPSLQWNLALSAANALAPGDYDGDRRLDAAVCTDTICRIQYSSTGGTVDVPSIGDNAFAVPGDYDGDGRTDMAMFQRGTGLWRVYLSSTEFTTSIERVFAGATSDVPVPGDYDGDGLNDFAVFRGANGWWYISLARGGLVKKARGRKGDKPFARDFDGDGRADLGVFRPSTRSWYIWTSAKGWDTALPAVVFGTSSDVPVPADYTGDGKAEIATFNPSKGVWSLKGIGTRKHGTKGDRPIRP